MNNNNNKTVATCSNCFSTNITITKKAKRTNGKFVHGKKMSYGYYYNEHVCNDCQNKWEEKIN